jgi:hypothetical protein
MQNAINPSPSTPDAAPIQAPQSQHRLSLEPSGQRLLWVTEGSELQGLSGPLQILLYPGQPDTRLPFRLQAGQGWRSPGTGWVCLHNPGAAPCHGQWQMAPETRPQRPPLSAAQPQKSRPGLRTWGRLMGAWLTVIRPGRRAT